MSRMNDIDSADPLFDLCDLFEPLSLLHEGSARRPKAPSILTQGSSSPTTPLYAQRRLLSCYEPTVSMETTAAANSAVDPKGKRVSFPGGQSEPMNIPHAGNVRPELDPFSISFESTGSSSSRRFESSSSTAHLAVFLDDHDIVSSDELAVPIAIGKGKGREVPPTLPPLHFSPTEFSYSSSEWPSTAGPSSYGSGYTSIGDGDSSLPTSSPLAGISSMPSSPDTAASPAPIMSRRRTLSSGSKQSWRSVSAPSLPKVKVKFAAAGAKVSSGTLARKLFKRSPSCSPRVSSSAPADLLSPTTTPDLSDLGYVGQGSCLIPWSREMRSRSPLATPIVETGPVLGAFEPSPVGRASRLIDPLPLRTKGRSYSSPLPLTASIFDIVPLAPTNIFEQPPVILPDYFDEYLPHELQLQVLAALVGLHAAEYEKLLREGTWTAHKASQHRNKWVGTDRGVRELFKLSRVSKSWQRLVFDGQLWAELDLHAFPKVPPSVLVRLAETAGGFIRTLDLSGHADLHSDVLMDITHLIAVHPTLTGEKNSNLTSINLQGCSPLSTRSLHYLLMRSPQLQRLCLRGQTAVTNTTCELLAVYCPRLVYLDLSLCIHLTGDGVRSVAAKAVERGEQIPLKELRLSGLRRTSDAMMAALGRAAPLLEVLDLSYAKDLHNSSIEAFVSCTETDADKFETVQLTPRDAGRDTSDSTRIWRRVTRLRHLNLSSCILLTDHACSHLAFAVPKLEFLELAAIGSELRDDGLVRLLKTTPYIRKLDLEDATDVNDAVLDVLTPSTPSPSPESPSPASPTRAQHPAVAPEPGHALEHLILSYTNVENETLTELIRACPRLRVLEADNTRMTGHVLREFVQHTRARRVAGAKIVAADCRSVGEHTVRELQGETRPRVGWRSWHARKLQYLDGADAEGLEVGQDECDPLRVAVKTFYSWQTVDSVRAAREKKRKSGTRRGMNTSSGSHISEDPGAPSSGRTRWWSSSGRRSGPTTPMLDFNDRGEGCMIM